jgi:hypothetical protein
MSPAASLFRDTPASTPRPAPFSAASSSPRGHGFTHDVRAQQFETMSAAYRRSGGIASGDHVAFMLRRRLEQPLSRLARWIVAREVVSFEHLGTTWLPLFQFDRAAVWLRPEVAAVIAELSDVLDNWELAAWFTRPHDGLHGALPVDALAACPSAVREAARADRSVVLG